MCKKVVAAGHICLDITPVISDQGAQGLREILNPGRLVHVGKADIHTGGAVANAGLAMAFLGADVTLAAKIGDDSFGKMVEDIINRSGAKARLTRSKNDETSYSIVLAVPGVDRIFLHNPGANNTFRAEDLPMNAVREAALLHFGYPPTMRGIYEHNGEELLRILRLAREEGTATSLDMAAVDPDSEAGKADWETILSRTLPYVDFFVPSVEELLFMLDQEKYRTLRRNYKDKDMTELLDPEYDLEPLGNRCLNLGAKAVLIKCGARGMYLCTKGKDEIESISRKLSLNASAWAGKRLFEKAFRPSAVLSATGAGDTSIAAFLVSMLNGDVPETCMKYAAATGACCVAAYDALSNLRSFQELDRMIEAGWDRNE